MISLGASRLVGTFASDSAWITTAPERPSEAAFEATDFHFYLARRETF